MTHATAIRKMAIDGPIIECVPNFSEGRDRETISALIEAARSIRGAALLDHTSDPDHNRTVLTIAGEPGSVAKAVFLTVAVAAQRIRLPEHQGVHPRMGAADVVPLIPVSGVTLEQCAELARATGLRIWNELAIPVFLYEAAARSPERKPLEVFRSSTFNGTPDFGTGRHATAGAAVVGARDFLIAWNVNLFSSNLDAARAIARAVRASSGGLPCVKALGLPLRSRDQVQVSINLTDFKTTPLHLVFERVRDAARDHGIRIAGSELIGLIPQKALELSAGHDLQWLAGDRIEDFVLEQRLQRAFSGAVKL